MGNEQKVPVEILRVSTSSGNISTVNDGGVFTKGFKTHNEVDEPSDFFTSAFPGFVVSGSGNGDGDKGELVSTFGIQVEDVTVDYNGEARTVSPTFWYGSTELSENDDVKVYYSKQAPESNPSFASWDEGLPSFKDAGTHTFYIGAVYSHIDGSAIAEATVTINQKDVTVSGITVADKEYDGSTDATLVVSDVTLTGLVTADAGKVTLTVSDGAGTFADANVGTNKAVTIDPKKLSLANVNSSNPAAGNYKLAESGQQTSAKGAITKKKLTVSGIAAKDKVYDGTTNVTLNSDNAVIDGMLASDDLFFTADGVLDSPDVGQGERVSLSNYQLTGSDAGNYQVAEDKTQTSAEITVQPRDVTVTPDEISSAVGAPLQKLTFTVSGLVDAAHKDSLKVKLSTTADSQKEGKYPITGTQDEGANPNYTVHFTDGIQYSVFVSKAGQPVVSASAYSGVYDQKTHSISVKVTDKDVHLLKDGLATVYYADKALDASNCQSAGSAAAPAYTDAGQYPVYYCVVFSGAYASAPAVSGRQNVTIEKAPQAAPDAPRVKTQKLESLIVEAQEGQEYSIDGKNWQTSGTFKRLHRNRQYKIYARLAGSANYYASPSSQATAVKTKALSSKLQLDRGMQNVQTGNQLDIAWGKVDDATGYRVFVQYCGKAFNKKPDFIAKTQDTTSVTLTSVNHKRLKLNQCVRVKVIAMKGKKPLCTSIFVHAMGRGKKGFANPTGIELKKDKFTLSKKSKKKKTAKIKAKAVLNRKGRQISDEHTAEFRYASSDNSVATVSEKGVLTAKGKGECFVFVYARSGFARMIRVTVK